MGTKQLLFGDEELLNARTMAEHAGTNKLYFDPDQHPEETLKAFNEFTEDFLLRYDANHPDPPKVSMDAAIQRWEIENDNAQPTVAQFDTIKERWQTKDKVAKFIGLYSSRRFFSDWKAAEPTDDARKNSTWDNFTTKMRNYYKPTENNTLKNYHFRSLSQAHHETFMAFCNRVEKESKHCEFKCASADCTAESTAVRDQIIIGLTNDKIREEALKESWSLTLLRTNGMKLDSATRGASELGDSGSINKLGKFSYKNIRNKGQSQSTSPSAEQRQVTCFFCGLLCSNIKSHLTNCAGKSSKCLACGKTGHFARVCRSKPQDTAPSVNEVREDDQQSVVKEQSVSRVSTAHNQRSEVYNINIFRLTMDKATNDDFKVRVVISGLVITILADTGAKISVCSRLDAVRWDILKKMVRTNIDIKPYGKNTPLIKPLGVARSTVTYQSRSIPVDWYIIEDDCEPILAGKRAETLGIISFAPRAQVFTPINMISMDMNSRIQNVVAQYPDLFTGTGLIKNYQVKLHVNPAITPKISPQRPTPYHLRDIINEKVEQLIKDDIFEVVPKNTRTPWISNMVIVPKPDGDYRITLDAKEVNKALLCSHLPIPHVDDIKAKLSGAVLFSTLDLKSAFWQLELEPESRNLTTFYHNDILLRYKRLSMGLTPAQGELNAAVIPIFAHIPRAHVIHDNLIIATMPSDSHSSVVDQVLSLAPQNGITFNPTKCEFGKTEVDFWGMIFSADGVKPDPKKVEVLDHLTPPHNKEDLISFLCMMQSNSDFIPEFSAKASKLRELTKKNVRFTWTDEHETCFYDLLNSFKSDALLQYFDVRKKTFIIVDGHKTGVGATLAQGDSVEVARPVAVASRTTNSAEKRYPQIDLEALSVDFALRRFRKYLVGSPNMITVVTDHKPLVPILSGKRSGSIRTQSIKVSHQDIPYEVVYQKGRSNQSDYLSRRAMNIELMPATQQAEADEQSNLLYMLHSTPIMDRIGLSTIATETDKDKTLVEIRNFINKNQYWVPKSSSDEVQKFRGIMSEITVTGNGILLKGSRIVLPKSLHDTALELAHRGAHPGRSGLARRLRYHFFFHGMSSLIENFASNANTATFLSIRKPRNQSSIMLFLIKTGTR